MMAKNDNNHSKMCINCCDELPCYDSLEDTDGGAFLPFPEPELALSDLQRVGLPGDLLQRKLNKDHQATRGPQKKFMKFLPISRILLLEDRCTTFSDSNGSERRRSALTS